MAFRRTTNLPCNVSKNITLRLHPDVYESLKEEAGKRTLDKGRQITIGDLIREIIDHDDDEHFTKHVRVPQQGSKPDPDKNMTTQLIFPFVY